jgi:hypothetical protein
VYADRALLPWFEALMEELPGVRLFDAHTHTGANDPDGYRCTAGALLDALALADARAAVFPMHEPGGYPEANDLVLGQASESAGRLVAFARLDPRQDPGGEAERCLRAGARGFKLHPRAERFTLDHPALRPVFALSAEARLPVLVHAGRGIPALGRHLLAQLERHPGARVILAHAGISDLGWLARAAAGHPGLFFDTAWWSPADLLALLALVPPGRVLWASDAPYGTPVAAAVLALRCALQVGLGREQVAGIAGGQLERLVTGEEPLDLGPAPGSGGLSTPILLERVQVFLTAAMGQLLVENPASEQLALARLACEVGDEAPEAPVCRSVLALLERHERHAREHAGEWGRQARGMHLLVTALAVARTPGVPLPALPEPVDVAERAA